MFRPMRFAFGVVMLLAVAGISSAARTAETVKLNVFAAGTLAEPFRALDAIFAREHPDIAVQPQFGGSVKMARQITALHQPCDVIAVADYNVIPKYLYARTGRPGYATWYAGFARNAITFVYTDKSKYAGEITPQNWYRILARPGVEIGRSNPDTDPSGYQTLQMLSLAQSYYHVPGLAAAILANAPKANMRDTETSLIAALQIGQIDYLAIYRSDALQHHLRYLDLPPQIDLGDPADGAAYAKAVAHTKNGDVPGTPIVYAVSVPTNAAHPDLAAKYVALLLGPQGQRIVTADGFGGLAPAYAPDPGKLPTVLRALVRRWPAP
jgi:molybdate/tungstate transport system substrate-binding protein